MHAGMLTQVRPGGMEGGKATGVLWMWENECREGLSAGRSESKAQLAQHCLSRYEVLMPLPGQCSELGVTSS